MQRETGIENRALKRETLEADLVVIGGGLAGTACAVTAARAGLRVVLVQDRPVLGGNASSEVRLWALGATSHLGNNNRWAREGGFIDEVLVENMFRNRDGNPVLLDPLLLEKVTNEPGITLLLNTAACAVEKSSPDTLSAVKAFCSQNSTEYLCRAPLFVDASGDGILGFLAGAAFRVGAEARDEFDEGLAPEKATEDLLGHSMYFYTKDVGHPVTFVPPAFALDDITKIPRFRSFNAHEHGCQLWWIEHGGRFDTVHDTEAIKWDLWKVVYGVWNHIKNSGRFPEAETLTLEWVSSIPGKRESRRFEGDYMLSQRDLVEQRKHYDAVSFGGWAIDLHPPDGVFSERPGCLQYHSKGVYQIPYRCLYSSNISNLFLAGRIISATHIAFGSTRVMATCAHSAQAVGMAAARCTRERLLPRDLARPEHIASLQRDLVRSAQYIPGLSYADEDDLASSAEVTATSSLRLAELAPGDETVALDMPRAMAIPVRNGVLPEIGFWASAPRDTEIEVQLRACTRLGSFTPDVTLASEVVRVAHAEAPLPAPSPAMAGRGGATAQESSAAASLGGDRVAVGYSGDPFQPYAVKFEGVDGSVDADQYLFVCFMANPSVRLRLSDRRLSGILSLVHKKNHRVAEGAVQDPPGECGIDALEFWTPERRPEGKNIALRIDPPLPCFEPESATRYPYRPNRAPNAWVADPDDPLPTLTLAWDAPVCVTEVDLHFDTDFDHPMESVLMGHPESVMPFCVRSYRVKDDRGNVVAECGDNHQAFNRIRLSSPATTRALHIELDHPGQGIPAALFGVRCYGEVARRKTKKAIAPLIR